jgi:hypothetical protein
MMGTFGGFLRKGEGHVLNCDLNCDFCKVQLHHKGWDEGASCRVGLYAPEENIMCPFAGVMMWIMTQ